LYYKSELHFISNKQGQFKFVLISLRNSNNNYDYNCYVLIIIIIFIILFFKIILLFGSIIIIFKELHFEIQDYKNHFVLQYIDPEHVEELRHTRKMVVREREVERDVKKNYT